MRSIFQNRVLTIIIIVLLVANLGVLVYYAFCKDDRRGGGPPRGRRSEFAKKTLGFDDKQMKTFEEAKIKNKERLKQLFDESAKAKDSFYQLVLIDNLDDSLLFDRALNIAQKQQAIDMEFFRQFKTLQGMCTPEQLPKFDSGFMPMVMKMYRRDSLERK